MKHPFFVSRRKPLTTKLVKSRLGGRLPHTERVGGRVKAQGQVTIIRAVKPHMQFEEHLQCRPAKIAPCRMSHHGVGQLHILVAPIFASARFVLTGSACQAATDVE